MQGYALRRRSNIDALVRFIGRGTVRGTLYDLGAYPALRPGEGRVAGELYAMIDAQALLACVDAIEGYVPDDVAGSEFVRRVARVRRSGGPETSAWIYEFNRGVGASARIVSGDYAAYGTRHAEGRHDP